ncbi:MAG: glycoside hydrolase family 2 protein, partial [Halanaerobium sp.]
WLELIVNDEIIADNFVSFARPKHMQLKEPGIKANIKKINSKRFEITFMAQKCALWTRLELEKIDVLLSDNFFHLYPGREVVVTLKADREMTVEELKKCLKIRSLIDTYKE